MQIEWQPRQIALEPIAIAARGTAARALARRLTKFDDENLAQFAGVFAPDLIVIFGDSNKLPWVDEGIYLGRDAGANSILLPTNYQPKISANLFEKILLAKFKEHLPFAVLRQPNHIVTFKNALPINRTILNRH